MKVRKRQLFGLFAFTLAALGLPRDLFGQTETNPPIVTILASDPDASEIGPDTGKFTITRTGPTNSDLLVFYHAGGSARPGVDYQALSGLAKIPAGATSADITVTPIADVDTTFETNETVKLQLLRPFSFRDGVEPPILWPPPYLVGSPSNAVVNIAEDGLLTNPPPHVRIVSPLNGSFFLAPAEVLLVAHAEDSNGKIDTVEFFEGTNSLGIRTNLPVANPLGPFVLTWSNVAAGEYDLTAKATDDQGASTISRPVQIKVLAISPPTNPAPVVRVVASDADASEIGPDAGTFTVSRDGSTNTDLTVFYYVSGTARPGVDYKALSGRVTISAGAMSADITVTPIADVDTTFETNETVKVRLVPPYLPPRDSGWPGFWPPPYVVGAPSNAVVNIAESGLITNPPPRVRIVSPENGRKFTAPASIQIVARAEDRNGTVRTVEFFEGTNSLGLTTNMAVMNPLGPFVLIWSNVVMGEYRLTAKATDDQGATRLSEPLNISVSTNSPPPERLPVVVIFARDPVALEGTNSMGGTNSATFVVRRSDGTNNDLTVYYSIGGSASNGVDYVTLPVSVTIPAGERSAKIAILPLEDSDHEPLNTVVLQLTPPPTAIPPTYTIGYPGKAAAIIVDRSELGAQGEHLPGGLFHFQLPGMDGFHFRVEASDDLANWTAICTNVVTEGAIQFVDPDAGGRSRRFYRVVPEADANTGD